MGGGGGGSRCGIPAGSKQPQSQQQSTCTWCGKCPVHDKAQCPARNQTCNKCNKLGHFAVVCRTSKKSRQVQTLKEMPSWVLSRMRAVGQTGSLS